MPIGATIAAIGAIAGTIAADEAIEGATEEGGWIDKIQERREEEGTLLERRRERKRAKREAEKEDPVEAVVNDVIDDVMAGVPSPSEMLPKPGGTQKPKSGCGCGCGCESCSAKEYKKYTDAEKLAYNTKMKAQCEGCARWLNNQKRKKAPCKKKKSTTCKKKTPKKKTCKPKAKVCKKKTTSRKCAKK